MRRVLVCKYPKPGYGPMIAVHITSKCGNVDFNTSGMSHIMAGFPMIAICFSGFPDIIFRFDF